MDLLLSGSRALILGSSAGMGRAIATSLAKEGAFVFITGRNPERVTAFAREVGAAGSVAADLTRSAAPAQIVEMAIEALGGLDILVGNAGGGRPGGLVDASLEDINSAYEQTLYPQLAAIKAAIPALRAESRGRIVVLAARSVLEASPELALSSVFRSGVAAAAKSLALELAPDVTVNVVVPGQFDTGALRRFEAACAESDSVSEATVRSRHIDAIPMGRIGRAEEVGDLVTYLVSPKARYITGATIRIDGGLTRGF